MSTKKKPDFPDYKIVPIDDLIPYAKNSRTHSEEQIDKIVRSIEEYGFLNPVIVDGKNGIAAGHGRVLACQKLGMKEIPVIDAKHLTAKQKRAYVIADNRLALDANWDRELLKFELADLDKGGFDITLTGFELGELTTINLEHEIGNTDAAAEWQGMPEYEALEPSFAKCIVSFDSEADRAEFFKLIGQTYTEKTKSAWFPEKDRRDLESQRFVDD